MSSIDRNRLKGKIAERGLTQRALSNYIGISENSLSGKISGKAPFNTNEILAICDVLKITDDAEKAQIFLSAPSQNRDSATL